MGNNSSPQGDGNLLRIRCSSPCRRETIHPRKGTETRADGIHRHLAGETIHPRKGTETRKRRYPVFLLTKQFIPARGRKRCSSPCRPYFSAETIHPRKGTETFDLGHFGRPFLGKQFIPARGRKRGRQNTVGTRAAKQFIPARGRKPGCIQLFQNVVGNNSSPQGDGNLSAMKV